jgi:hypothetical protein
MNVELDADVAAILRSTPGTMEGLLRAADGVPPPPERTWSVREVAAHLLNVETIVFRERIRRIIEEERPTFRTINPSGELTASGLLQESGLLSWTGSELAAALRAMRNESLAWVATLPGAGLERTGEHDRAGTISGWDIARYWGFHDLVHVRQAMAVLQAGLAPRLGNTRLFIEEV